MSETTLLGELTELTKDRRVERVRAAPDPDALLVELGDEAERLAVVEVSRALRASALVVELADAVGRGRSRVRSRRARAQALAYAGRFEEALAVCEEAKRIGGDEGETIETARVDLASMHALGEMARFDEALAAGEAAHEVFASAGEAELGARADINLGVICQNRDDPAGALRHFARAREALPDDSGLLPFFIENNSGEALLLLNEFRSAGQAFDRARGYAEREEAAFARALAEGNLGDLAARRGYLHGALFHFERARRCFESDAASSHHARLLAEQAEVLESLGMLREALTAYADALPRLEKHQLRTEAARALAGKGKCLSRLKRSVEAEAALSAAAKIYEALGQPRPRARIDLIRAEIALAQGRFDEAERLAQGAREAFTERPADEAIGSAHLARLALARGNLEAAERELAVALARIEGFELAPLRADLLHCRARLLRARGKDAEALRDLRASIDQIERIRGTLQAERFRAAFLGDRLAVYADAVRATLDQGGSGCAAAALELVEKAKSRALLDLTGGALDTQVDRPSDDPEEADLAARTRTARAELNALFSRFADADSQDGQAAEPWRETLTQRERELAELEQRLSATRSTTNLYAQTATIEEVRAALEPESVLIEYFVAADELLAFVVRGTDCSVQRLGAIDAVREAVRRARFQINRGLRPGAQNGTRAAGLVRDARRELQRVWEQVLAPLEDQIGPARRALIVPHDCLHLTPFCALYDGRAHLVERMETVTSPSASLLAQLVQTSRSPAEGRRAAVFGVGDALAPQIENESRAVAMLLETSELRIGAEATSEALWRAAQDAEILHLACHGRFSATHQAESGLRLADRWVTVRDIYRMQTRARLVVLSGCDTGRAQIEAGDELLGLLRGFFAAGAESLIVSLWLLSDIAATNMMRCFYNEWLHKGRAKGAALRAAQLETLRNSPHPAVWAPLTLVGKP